MDLDKLICNLFFTLFIKYKGKKMSNKIIDGLKYSVEHEWLKIDGDIATIGITDHAQNALGDLVFIELPEIGKTFAKNDVFAVVESVKAASEVYAPITGEIIEINESLVDSPDSANSDPYGEGWLVKVKIAEKSEIDVLMNSAGYKEMTKDS